MNAEADPSASPLLESGATKGAAVLAGVLLHGRDRTREDKVVLASSFWVSGIRWLAPAADTGSWYPGRFFEPRAANEPFLTRAIAQLDRVVEQAAEGGRLGAERLVMVGFSQGACLTIEYALQRPGRCGALIVLTGALIGPPDTVWPSSPRLLAGTRVLLTGSDADDWISEEQTRHTARVLESLGADVHLRVYHGRPHIVCEDEMLEARELLRTLHDRVPSRDRSGAVLEEINENPSPRGRIQPELPGARDLRPRKNRSLKGRDGTARTPPRPRRHD